MKSSIITISRQFGSGGHEIGKQLSKRLGYRFYDGELINLAAASSGLPRDFFHASETHKEAGGGFLAEFASHNSDKIFAIQADIIKQIADTGRCVIVGRCADYILESWDAFDIFVHASMDARVERVSKLHPDWDKLTAVNNITSTDKARAEYYNHYTNKSWGQASNYALSIDSSRFGVEGCVDAIAKLVDEC